MKTFIEGSEELRKGGSSENGEEFFLLHLVRMKGGCVVAVKDITHCVDSRINLVSLFVVLGVVIVSLPQKSEN